ncbi:endo-1,4-beta-xylanase [Mollisia scopiformis]|uniref:Endo-1,4-beta-xylanase n=1 Tax=Mollisia scopiformis TaxID=149040 RepID=A0A194WVD1_MOLSC|nr:endo-1,4-beta-xylanase [Mollisia scopiformis]KUJ11552.1 endo-1,4-beta-xylanase [Mollisia scopiformis]
MVSLRSFLVASMSVAAAIATPYELATRDTIVTTSTTGTAGGYYYSCYIESGSGVSMDIGTGTYKLTWTTAAEDVVAGIGWSTGAVRTISYTGSLSASGDSLLALYGWTTSPLVEYYVIETYGTYNPGSAGTLKGTVTSDGSVYDIYEVVRTDAPSIQGTATFNQYLSIRQTERTSGTITLATHFNAWAALGMDLGTFNYQIMATEGYESAGSSSITIT